MSGPTDGRQPDTHQPIDRNKAKTRVQPPARRGIVPPMKAGAEAVTLCGFLPTTCTAHGWAVGITQKVE